MQSKRMLIPLLAAVALPAMAQNVQINSFSFGGTVTGVVNSTTPGLSGEYYMDQFSGTLNGASFVTYCLEIPQAPLFGTSVPYTMGMSWDANTAMSRAYTWVANTLQPTDALKGATAQAVLWEVLYETSGSYGFNSGNFQISSGSALPAVDWSYIQDNSRQGLFTLNRLENGTYQDLLYSQPVPEVSTYALMLAGLAVLGGVARRRNRS